MSDEWADSDDPRLRDLCGYALRAHVRYQDGRDSLAPALVFADADYEVGDGTCGLHPAIVYARADALVDMADRIAALEAERDAARDVAKQAINTIASVQSYKQPDDPWEENALTMCEHEVFDFDVDVARAALQTDTGTGD